MRGEWKIYDSLVGRGEIGKCKSRRRGERERCTLDKEIRLRESD